MQIGLETYSYRADPSVPDFADDGPVIIFDGVCVLCSWSLQFVLRHDHRQTFRFIVAQSPLGEALYRHYRLDPLVLETVLLMDHGRAYGKLDAFAQVMKHLPLPWRVFALARVIPSLFGDWLYDRIARNRYRIFGRIARCMVPSLDLKDRFLG